MLVYKRVDKDKSKRCGKDCEHCKVLFCYITKTKPHIKINKGSV